MHSSKAKRLQSSADEALIDGLSQLGQLGKGTKIYWMVHQFISKTVELFLITTYNTYSIIFNREFKNMDKCSLFKEHFENEVGKLVTVDILGSLSLFV